MKWLIGLALAACQPVNAVAPTPTEEPTPTPQIVYVTPAPTPVPTPLTVVVWDRCAGGCRVTAGAWMAAAVPDTFVETTRLEASVPISLYFMTLDQYVAFYNCGGRVSCVPGDIVSYGPALSINATFMLARGCASYVSVIQSSQDGTLKPHVSVRHDPASGPTGVCAD